MARRQSSHHGQKVLKGGLLRPGVRPGARRAVPGNQDAQGIRFNVPALAAARIAEDAAKFKEAQAGHTLVAVAHGGGNQAGRMGGTQHGVILAERQGHADEVTVLKGAQGQGILHLGDGAVRGFRGDELDGLGFIKSQGRQLAAQLHLEIVGRIHRGFRHEGAGEAGRYAVQAEDAHDFLQQVARTREVQAVGGDQPAFGRLRNLLQAQRRQDACPFLMGNGTAGHLIQRLPGKFHKAQFISHRGALPLLQGSGHGNGAVRPPAGRHGSMRRIRNGRTGHIRWGGRSARQLKNQFHGAHGTAQDIPGGSAAFKAVGGVGGQGQPAGRGAHGGGLEPGGLQNDIRSGVRHAAFLPTHHAADGERLAGLVRDNQVRAVKRVFLAVQSLESFPFISGAGDDAALHFRRVKGMEGRSQFMQDEVGNIHNVVDGAQTDGYQAFLQPFRAFLHVHAADFYGGVVRVQLRLVQPHEVSGGFQRHSGVVNGNGPVLPAGDSGQFIRHAVVGKQVRPVGRHFHFHQGIRLDNLGNRRAGFQFLGENPETVLLVGKPQLGGGTEHAAGLHAAQLAHLDFKVAGQHRSRQGAGHLVSHFVVLRAAYDLVQRAVAHVHLADLQPVRLGMLFRGGHAGHHHVWGIHALLADVFHLNAGKGQHVRHFIHAQAGQVNILGKPVKGNLHNGKTGKDYWNWARKRTSFSIRARMSLMPQRIIARRSRPMPKAKPVSPV